jgi:hypothetical protein
MKIVQLIKEEEKGVIVGNEINQLSKDLKKLKKSEYDRGVLKERKRILGILKKATSEYPFFSSLLLNVIKKI